MVPRCYWPRVGWKDFARMSDAELGLYDIAHVNIASTEGLPGTEQFQPHCYCSKLDWMAWEVYQLTQRREQEFLWHPERFKHSRAYFCSLTMVTVLQRDLGVCYNPAKIPLESYHGVEDSSIHGPLLGEGGTCTSLPVLYVAVGRRLGYPLKLVTAGRHMFVRWDAPDERLNIEATNLGLICYPDERYRHDIYETTPEEEAECCYLKSLTPRQELSDFLVMRGFFWKEHNNLRLATEAMMWACELFPENQRYPKYAGELLHLWTLEVGALAPKNMPRVVFGLRNRQFKDIPVGAENLYTECGVFEGLLKEPEANRKWWEPLRRNPEQRPMGMPREIVIEFKR